MKNLDYNKGFIDGLKAYAYWVEGEEMVGTTGTTLAKAIENHRDTWNYNPPHNTFNLITAAMALDEACENLYHEYHYYLIEKEHAKLKSAISDFYEELLFKEI